jgi:hypothetical protein
MDTKILSRVEKVKTVRVESPLYATIVGRRMVWLDGRGIDCHGTISTVADLNLLALEQFTVGISCCNHS